MNSRPAAVADMFYPGDPAVLRGDIRSYINEVKPGTVTPKAIISPHAGYMYSGPTAAFAYAQLKQAKSTINRVVLLGPCHRVPLEGLAVPSVDFFETPLGNIPLDRASIEQLLKLPQVQEFDLTHREEHSLEVQLPFLQEILDDFSIVPLVVGNTTAQEVSQVLETSWGGDETLIVISSDLSHYHDYDSAIAIDSETCTSIESLNSEAINHNNACGSYSIKGLLECAKTRNMKVTTLDVRNSGDTAGTKDRVVGYGAWMFEETD